MSKREREHDASLVAAVQAGDGCAASALWRKHAPMVARMLRKNLGSSVDVEDLTQEIFIVVFQRLGVLRAPAALKEFIFGVTARTCVRERRRLWRLRTSPTPDGETPVRDAVAREVEARIALDRLFGVIGRLRPKDRAATVLRLVESRPLNDIASAMDVSIATAKRRIARGSARVALMVERDPLLAQYLDEARSAPPGKSSPPRPVRLSG